MKLKIIFLIILTLIVINNLYTADANDPFQEIQNNIFKIISNIIKFAFGILMFVGSIF